MAETDIGRDEDVLGPVDYLIIEWPDGQPSGEGVPYLLDLVDRSVIRILDLVFVTVGEDGEIEVLEVSDLDGDGELDLAVFDGASSGLLDEADLVEAASVLAPGSAAAVLVYENVWAAPLAGALRRNGAQMVATGRIPAEDLLAAVED
ncbi:DUF6325 family protein [Brachybacterium sp. YJGR34]|uniref:DUF6325 family protein n=1 Tax=Brachybacterium sp. YJGR34 TaxID=2059911 RepID=UPI000E0BA675|nr:DUF6325 family protein [Brachybacterium sp. YJGR34]